MTWLNSLPDPQARCPAGPPGMQLVIEVEVSQDTTTVLVLGELDLITRPILAERLSAVLATRPRRLVLDLARTGFMDCGSARLVAQAALFLPDGGRLIIRRPSPVVRRVLELTGFDADCEIEDDPRS